MEAQPFFLWIGWGALAFGLLLLTLPTIQVVRGVVMLEKVRGLLLSGVGFLLFGTGLAFAHRGLGFTVLPGIALTAAGHFWQSRLSRE